MRGYRGIQRISGEKEKHSTRVEWIEQFSKDLASGKAYKDLYSNSQNSSFIEQLYSLIGNKNGFQTVESKVKDMQERAGLSAFLQRNAQANNPFSNFSKEISDKIEIFVKNKINTYKGFIPTISLQEDIVNIFKHDGIENKDVYNDQVESWLKAIIEEEKTKNPTQKDDPSFLGKFHQDKNLNQDANSDFFYSIMPKNK